MQRTGRAESDKCPACQHIVETDWHILNCPRRSLWREEFLSTLGDLLHINRTQPDLHIILLQGIRGALSDQRYQMNNNNREHRFRLLVHAQNKIGWQHLLKGRFSKQWNQIQTKHIADDPDLDPEKQSGERWMKRVINHIWTNLWKVWLIRNDDLHGRDKFEKERKRIDKLTPRIIALYAQKDILLAQDKDILALPITDRLKQHSRELTTWLALVTPTIKRAAADAAKHLHNTNHVITSFLPHARDDPLTADELVNELRPVSRLFP
jgi:hypothetical protein